MKTLNVKVKVTLEQARGGVEVYLYPFFNFGTRWWRVVSVTPRPIFPPGKEARYTLHRRLGGAQGRSREVWKMMKTLAN